MSFEVRGKQWRPSGPHGARALPATLLAVLTVTLAAHGSPLESSGPYEPDPEARALMDKVAAAVGTYADLQAKRDVQIAIAQERVDQHGYCTIGSVRVE